MAAHRADGGVFARAAEWPSSLITKKARRTRSPPHLIFDLYQAKLTLVLTLRRRRMAAPTRPKPEIIIAQAAGSGTAV